MDILSFSELWPNSKETFAMLVSNTLQTANEMKKKEEIPRSCMSHWWTANF